MVRRIAASLALVAFFVCILAGMSAENPFSTVVANALVALVVTFVVGLVLGAMAQKMLDENIAAAAIVADNSGNPEAKTTGGDR
jgi:NADH:ubiquinone oxidoreductase subunit H